MYDRRPKSKFCGLSVSEQAKPRATRRSGIWLNVSVACLLDVTFVAESHPNSKPYPIVAIAPRFCFVTHSAKLRLRKTQAFFSAQNDRLIVYFAIIVRFWVVIDAQNTLQNKKLLNLFTNRKKCDIIVMPNNLNSYRYRFFVMG